MPDHPMFQYIVAPEGLAHLRLPHELRTLCGLAATDEWKTPNTTRPEEPICRSCFRQVTVFATDILKDGKHP